MSRTSDWKKEIDALTEATGISKEEVCEYLDIQYQKGIGWYRKLPRRREMFIGIGMGFKQDLAVIDDWIVRYGDKQRLYPKDLLSDLIWIYLINSNHKDQTSSLNYYQLYDRCKARVRETYIELWNEYIQNSHGTASVEEALGSVEYDEEFQDLRAFIIDNMDSFKTAYSRPRTMLGRYVQAILGVYTTANEGKEVPINFLRGYLDDAMINYLTGDTDKINVLDMKSRGRTAARKPIPKLRKTHISLCLALGMVAGEVDHYLDLMGYAPLDKTVEDEGRLLRTLGRWEKRHELVHMFKIRYIEGDPDEGEEPDMDDEQRLQASSDMLMLRSDLEYEYRQRGWKFPYMKD